LAGASVSVGSRRMALGAILVVAAVAAFGWVVIVNARDLVEQTNRIEATWGAVRELEATLSALRDAETGQRGYLLTGDASYLTTYENGVAEVRDRLPRLRALSTSRPPWQARLDEFGGLVEAKLGELAETVRLYSSGDRAAALQTVQTGFGRNTMDRIRVSLATMRSEEDALLAERTRRAAASSRRVTAAAVAGALASLALFGTFVVVVRRDILARSRTQAALRQSEQRLRTTLRSIGDAVMATDAAGRVTFLNAVAERLTGWELAEATGRPVEEVLRIVDEGSRAAVESPVRRVIEDGAVVGMANHALLIARDGAETPIADSAAPIRDARGRLDGVVLVFRDIAAQRKAEREAQRLAAIAASVEYAIVAETVDNIITDWNPGAQALFGFTAEEMIGRKMVELAPPGTEDPASSLTAELLAGRRIAEFDARRRTKDGRWIEVVVSLSAIRDASGQVIGVSRMIRDVTERRRQSRELEEARHRAEEASAAKDRFLATLSHELRTPLTPVVASIHRLERRPDLGPGMAESLAMIRRNVELEARLIDDLLDLTRISAGKIELDCAPLDLHAVLRSVVQSVRSEFFRRGLELVLELEASDHHCLCDGARLQQVFLNLIQNSAKFTPTGGRVTLRSENPARGRIRVIVRDTGQGIRQDLLARIFDAFEQGDATARRRAGGLGLGLAIARNLVDLHGGSISAESEGENRGATFSIDLATTEERPLRATPEPAGVLREETRRSRPILLVEDDVDTGVAVRALLEEAGFEVRLAEGVEAARRAFRDHPAEILVTDLGLPDGSGLDLFASLKALHPDLRGIVLSGYGMESDLERSRSLGLAEHLVKPLSVDRLIAALDRLGATRAPAAQK
jgi:two-component system CheB/CheR fusion protein